VGSKGFRASRAARRRSALTSAAGRCIAATSRPAALNPKRSAAAARCPSICRASTAARARRSKSTTSALSPLPSSSISLVLQEVSARGVPGVERLPRRAPPLRPDVRRGPLQRRHLPPGAYTRTLSAYREHFCGIRWVVSWSLGDINGSSCAKKRTSVSPCLPPRRTKP